MTDIWNINAEWYQDESGKIYKTQREQGYTTDSINDIYFKIQKAFSGVCYTYTDNLQDIYRYDLLMGDGYSLDNFFNEYDVIDKYLKNFIQVDVASTTNVNITKSIFLIDGIKLKPTHTVLLKNQTSSGENNIYTVDNKNYLVKTDRLSTRDKSERFKVFVKLGDVNISKQWFLYYNSNRQFPILDEPKTFVERHSYIIKHKLVYDIDNIPTYSGNTHKIVFSDYDIARKINNVNCNLWSGITFSVASISPSNPLDIYYYNKQYRISVQNTPVLYDSYDFVNENIVTVMDDYSGDVLFCQYSTEFADNLAWKVFDGNLYTSWVANDYRGWLMFTLYEPVAIWKYALEYDDSMGKYRAPRDWTFEGSNDAINWVVLDTQQNQTNWSGSTNTYREYSFNNEKVFEYYRLNITDNNGGDKVAVSIINLYKVDFTQGSARNYVSYNNKDACNIPVYDGTNFLGYDTQLKTSNFSNLVVGDYIEVEFRKDSEMFCKFNTFIKSINSSGVTITDLIPTWVLNQIDSANNNAQLLAWIIRNVQHIGTYNTDAQLVVALKKSFFSNYFTARCDSLMLTVNPLEYAYNMRFDYGSLKFSTSGLDYAFTTNNSYINYKLYPFLNAISPSVFTANRIIYNTASMVPVSSFYVENEIIQLNSTSNALLNFTPFTYVSISGTTHASKTIVLKIEGNYMWIEKPKYFDFHEQVISVKNIGTLSEISDILYDVYKNEDFGYYIPKGDYIRKYVCLSYGKILNSSVVRNYTTGLLCETLPFNRNFIFNLYNVQNDDNMLFQYKYRPIEIMDVGIDKKTMIPKSLIYPDFFTYKDREYTLDDDYNVLNGDEMLTEFYIDANAEVSDSIVIDNSI